MSETATTIEVCVDCATLFANGEVFDGDGNDIAADHAAKITAIWGDAQLVLAGPDEADEDTAEWFSWQSCDGCGSHLGGNRMYATAFTREGAST